MAAATSFNQDFVTFRGDAPTPIFTVVDSTGAAVDISAATEIAWSALAQSEGVPVLTLLKSTGGISFVTTGVDGKFQVLLSAANTTALNGAYQHQASVTLGGKILTTTFGRMLVNQDWSYNPSQIASVPMFAVRRLVGDVIPDDQQLFDSEILFALTQRAGNIYGAGADCARYLAGQYSRKVDTTSPGGLQTAYGTQAQKYLELAASLDAKASGRGLGAMPYAGGISIRDKVNVQANTDRVQPQFILGMDDNFIPIPAGPNQRLIGNN